MNAECESVGKDLEERKWDISKAKQNDYVKKNSGFWTLYKLQCMLPFAFAFLEFELRHQNARIQVLSEEVKIEATMDDGGRRFGAIHFGMRCCAVEDYFLLRKLIQKPKQMMEHGDLKKRILTLRQPSPLGETNTWAHRVTRATQGHNPLMEINRTTTSLRD
ncbi:hypothetical protein T4E_5091 [Trichinella pseudospiralis]|uniref:Uncharacterized protein n=1 Tax=Trichinella pseudospiralis TaxID=6337 RepID=A0A0V0XPG0_TRIPS|nr:hypothetical protein T4E_5221 [Trichinella pseudospiralis]KRX89902.1 hypothetical protein T4E_5091 [Trichinella pseudospiralis]